MLYCNFWILFPFEIIIVRLLIKFWTTSLCLRKNCKKMKFSIQDSFNKYEEICSFLRIWSHLLKKSLMKNFSFCAVKIVFTVFQKILFKLDWWKTLSNIYLFLYLDLSSLPSNFISSTLECKRFFFCTKKFLKSTIW